MRLRGLFIILQVMMCFCLSAKIRTLSICIGEYPAESGWNDLGANNDADLIRDCFHDAKIILNEEATNKKILTELTFLTSNTSKGDTVIIHFSGHGQQILSDESSKEVDLVDEAIVPYDAYKIKSATYNGQAHITDDVFGGYISEIRNATGHTGLVIALIDACHSDSMDKDADSSDYAYRGTDEIFGAETLSVDSIAKLRKVYDTQDESQVITLPESSNVIFISACATHQRNYEIKVGDSSYGSLTYYFCKAYEKTGISDLNDFLSYFYAEMTSNKVMKFHGQTPVIRNTLGWKAPKSKIFKPTDIQPTVNEVDSKAHYWWSIPGVLVVIILILMLCQRRNK